MNAGTLIWQLPFETSVEWDVNTPHHEQCTIQQFKAPASDFQCHILLATASTAIQSCPMHKIIIC